MFSYLVIVSIGVGVWLGRALLRPPPNFPRNIPTVPFWYCLLPVFGDQDQELLYRRYLKAPLETFGAVKIYFGGRWNILIQQAGFDVEVFKQENVYQKAGNHVKIPHSVVAEYTGDNIISSTGREWILYRSIVRQGLQRHLEEDVVRRNASKLVEAILQERESSPDSVLIQPILLRWTIRNVGESILGIQFDVSTAVPGLSNAMAQRTTDIGCKRVCTLSNLESNQVFGIRPSLFELPISGTSESSKSKESTLNRERIP
jgi:cytochrome P450